MAYAIKGTSPFAAFAQDDGFTDSGAAAPLKHAAYDSGSFSGCSGRQPSSMPATPGAAARSSTSVWQRHRSILLAMGLLVAVLGAVLLLEPSAQSAAERLQRHEQQQQQPSLAPRPALPQVRQRSPRATVQQLPACIGARLRSRCPRLLLGRRRARPCWQASAATTRTRTAAARPPQRAQPASARVRRGCMRKQPPASRRAAPCGDLPSTASAAVQAAATGACCACLPPRSRARALAALQQPVCCVHVCACVRVCLHGILYRVRLTCMSMFL